MKKLERITFQELETKGYRLVKVTKYLLDYRNEREGLLLNHIGDLNFEIIERYKVRRTNE